MVPLSLPFSPNGKKSLHPWTGGAQEVMGIVEKKIYFTIITITIESVKYVDNMVNDLFYSYFDDIYRLKAIESVCMRL